MTIKFDVAARKKNFSCNKTPSKKINTQNAIKEIIGGDIEQCSENSEIINYASSNLVGAVQLSFADHYPLILDPDSVWLTIERGLATHITENSEQLRSKFVNFEGKQNIDVRRDHFVKGGVNDWEGCFDEFSEKIGEHIGPQKDLIVGNFSTTGTLEKVSGEIVLMDAMSKYFTYSCTTCCGIPFVILEGTVEDWELLRHKANKLRQYNLEWWLSSLDPVLEKIVESAKGNVDLDFWDNFYSEGGASGGPFINGHIIKLYPYLTKYDKTNYKNDYIGDTNKRSFGGGITIDCFPKGTSTVPFVWNYFDLQYPMEFIGGIIGPKEVDGAVKCAFGWVVRDASVPLDQYPMDRLVVDMKIYNSEGDVGLLKKAVKEELPNGGERLCDLEILWQNKGLVKYTSYEIRYNINTFFVKDVVKID